MSDPSEDERSLSEEEKNVEEPRKKKKKLSKDEVFDDKAEVEEENEISMNDDDDEEEDEEGLDQYEEDGFVVDDNAEEEEEDMEERERKEEKRKKKKKKKKKKKAALDDEDLQLIEEASGLSFRSQEKRKFKRIKKKTRDEDQYSLIKDRLFDDVGEEEEEEQQDIVQEEEEVEESDLDEEDDLDGFIVDQIDEFGEPVQPKKKKRKHREYHDRSITNYQLSEARDIFGDTSFLEQEEEEEEEDEISKERVATRLEDHYDAEELRQKYISKEDEFIRITDIPERHQLRFPNRPSPDENEIKLEAEWIYTKVYAQMEDKPPHTIVPKIVCVLEYLRKDHYEVPYIATYKEDYYGPELELVDLWEIYDLDEKWSHLYVRKKALKKLYTKVHADQDLIKLLDESTSESDVQDLFDHFKMHYLEEIPSASKYKKASKTDPYKQCKREGILEFSKHFGLSAKEFGENMMENHLRHSPIDHEKSPDDLAIEFISAQFSSVDLVLAAARYALAKEIAYDPRVRASVRQIYEEKATISTFPTPKARKEIDAFHPYRIIMRLDNKPLHEFYKPGEDGTQFLLILKASKEGFIKIKIGMSDDLFLNEMENLFMSEGYSIEAEAWNEQRKLILKEAVTRHLYPLFEKEFVSKISQEARDRVTELCSSKLREKILIAPYKPEKLDEDDPEPEQVSVMACCWGPGNIATMCVMLNSKGEYVDHLKLDYLDKDKLAEFVKTHHPGVIVVGAQLEARRLYDELKDIVDNQLRSKYRVHVAYAPLDVATVYSNSSRASTEFPQFPQLLKQAISLGRYIKDPLQEVSGLCNESREILCLNLHSLQGMVTKEQLETALHRCVINVVNHVGVDINKAIQHTFLSHTLRFVAGLGPRKALGIINKIYRRGGYIGSREDLEGMIGPIVYHNCAGFIRIVDGEELLDDTRIHPDDYSLVKKMAKDALEDTVQRKKIDDDSALIETLMENPSKLEDIDLDAFADELEKKLKEKKRSILFNIKKEIENPFQEKRMEYRDPTPEELFTLMTGETPNSIPIGQLVYCRISRVMERLARCRLDSGLPGTILVDDISDSRVDRLSDLNIEVGTTLACRIKGIDVERITVNLTCRSSDLQSERWEQDALDKLKKKEPYLVIESMEEEKVLPKKQPPQKTRLVLRQINHPLFQNVSFQDAEKRLNDEPVGEVIIRPSSRGIDHLAITWKFHEDVYVHITVKEEDKITPQSLGKILWIGHEQFEDLDEILARFIEPMNSYLQEMKNFRKFRDISKTQLDELLKQEKENNPQSIPYYISISYEIPGKFLLGYMPVSSKPAKHEYISVTHEGFRFRKQTFHKPEDLIVWFKRNWKSIRQSPRNQHVSSLQETAPMIPEPSYDQSWTSGGWDRSEPREMDNYSRPYERDSRRDKYRYHSRRSSSSSSSSSYRDRRYYRRH